MEIRKMPTPEHIGPTPDWDPDAKRSSGGRGRPGGGKGGNRNGRKGGGGKGGYQGKRK